MKNKDDTHPGQPDDSKPPLASLKTKPFDRNLAITKMGVDAGARIALHTVGNLFRSREERSEANRTFYTERAQALVNELGQLKGSIMKAGQMLSLYGQYFLPKEAIDVLSTLQDNSQPVAWPVVQAQLRQALGQRMDELDIDERAIGAASLGQAHVATVRASGERVVVKIQYPGVADAIDSDIRTLSRLLITARIAPKALDLTPVFTEVREMLERECNYAKEKSFTQTFRERLASDTRFIVPQVHDRYCGPRTLTTSYEPGLSVRDPAVQALSLARRNRLGKAFVDLFLTEFFDWHLVQTDPHFGNYRIRLGTAEDGSEDRIVLLDFGATRPFGSEFVKSYAKIVRGALSGDVDHTIEGTVDINLLAPDTPRAVLENFAELAELIVEPFRDVSDPRIPQRLKGSQGGYLFGLSDIATRVSQKAALSAMSVHFQIPPREIVFLHRRMTGVLVTLASLHTDLNLGPSVKAKLDALATR
jgi:predicted unusual protein kinase regulating ubiquinone biosynthesis (AarF/ABC1/UbiB family)